MGLPATILVVEDQQDQMAFLTHILSEAGYRVVPAYGGDDAIRKVKAGKVDLVLTDLAMPKVTGVEVIHAIKSDPATRHIPVVAVTAHLWSGLGQSAGQVGADGFVSKPFTRARLLQEIHKRLNAPGTSSLSVRMS